MYIYHSSLLANRVQCGNKAQRVVVWLSGTDAMHVVGCTAHGARCGCTLRGCAGRMCILMRIHNVKALTDARFRTIACRYVLACSGGPRERLHARLGAERGGPMRSKSLGQLGTLIVLKIAFEPIVLELSIIP